MRHDLSTAVMPEVTQTECWFWSSHPWQSYHIGKEVLTHSDTFAAVKLNTSMKYGTKGCASLEQDPFCYLNLNYICRYWKLIFKLESWNSLRSERSLLHLSPSPPAPRKRDVIKKKKILKSKNKKTKHYKFQASKTEQFEDFIVLKSRIWLAQDRINSYNYTDNSPRRGKTCRT